MIKEPIQKRILAEYLDKKISFHSLAKKYGLSRPTVTDIIHKNGVKTKYFASIPEKEVINLYVKKGWSKEDVAAKFGVSISPIRRILLKSGHSIRNSSECHIGQVAWNKGKKWSKAMRKRLSKSAIGKHTKEKNPNWKGGRPNVCDPRRSSSIVKIWRSACLKRDGECKLCGSQKRLEVNHIIPLRKIVTEKLLADIQNGITLCHGCHKKIYRRENEFEDIFRNLLKKSHELRETPTGHKNSRGQS